MRSSRNGRPFMAAFAVSAAMMLTLPGCTPWPVSGSGGLAERHPVMWPDALVVQDRCLEVLRRGGREIAAGRMDEIRILLVRAVREYEGGLEVEAQLTLARADLILSGVERDLRRARPTDRARSRSG